MTLPDMARGRPGQDGPHSNTSPAAIVTDPADIAAFLELSDERDQWERYVLAMWRDGWHAAELAHAGDYHHGYIDGILGRKHAEHDAVEALRLELRRWGPGGREHFGDPRPGDFTGGPEAVEQVRQAWLRAGLSLGPGPGWVHVGGPPVHHHRCNAACYAYEPGWYTVQEAINIIENLPGNYAKTLARLRAQLPAEAA